VTPSTPSEQKAPEEQIAVVTGGASGMGLACGRRLALRGVAVAVLDRDSSAVKAVADLFPITGDTRPHRHLSLEVDVTVRKQVQETIERVATELGTPTILVNAAGIVTPSRFLEISEDEWRLVLDVSLTGAFFCAQACLHGMIDRGWGRIVNFSSTAGKSVSTLGGAHYTAAKAGVLGLTRAMAKELAPAGITVNAVCPGLIETPMVTALTTEDERKELAAGFPIPRLGTADEVAALVAFLCSDDAAYITGAALDINGGDLMV
jgi:NAD(P)-dependent dehydrogenase (short-subunit alcohol dehydrogenase family)